MKIIEGILSWVVYTLLLPLFIVIAVLREIWEWLSLPWGYRNGNQ